MGKSGGEREHLLSPTPPLLPGDFIRNSAGCWGNALIGHYIANHAISTHKSGHTNVHLRLKFPILTGLVHVRMLGCASESKRMDYIFCVLFSLDVDTSPRVGAAESRL